MVVVHIDRGGETQGSGLLICNSHIPTVSSLRASVIHRTLKHYRITALLGAGGMGAVYLAQDTKLDRKVALKILPPDVARNPDRMERFGRLLSDYHRAA